MSAYQGNRLAVSWGNFLNRIFKRNNMPNIQPVCRSRLTGDLQIWGGFIERGFRRNQPKWGQAKKKNGDEWTILGIWALVY